MPSERVRPPAVAGRFYPADPQQLADDVRRYLNAAQAPDDCLAPPLVKAIIAPHAGYVYSGPIAASAYVHLACSDIPVQRFILVGPAHFAPVRGLATSSADAFETPLGRVPIDAARREAALATPHVRVDDLAHRPEHCLEVQLPFLQVLFPDFTIVPLLVGDTDAGEVAAVLERLWGGPDTRIVISSDLSHYYSGAVARQLDAETAAAIIALDTRALRDDAACGRAAIAGLLVEAQRHAMTAAALDLRHSGDTGGPSDRVVGYGAFSFVEAAPAAF